MWSPGWMNCQSWAGNVSFIRPESSVNVSERPPTRPLHSISRITGAPLNLTATELVMLSSDTGVLLGGDSLLGFFDRLVVADVLGFGGDLGEEDVHLLVGVPAERAEANAGQRERADFLLRHVEGFEEELHFLVPGG